MANKETNISKSSDKALVASDFVHLHNHTHHSVLDGLQKIDEMVAKTKHLDMEAIAITDHGTLSGAIDFYKSAQAEEINPIIGIETYVSKRTHLDKDPVKDKQRYHLILLAMNNQGYKNLMRLSTIANVDGYYYKPRIDHELLEKYNEGIICLSGCLGSEIGRALENEQFEKAVGIAKWYKKIFGDRYYLEVQDHGHQWDVQEKVNKQIFKLADKLSIKKVVTADAHYLNSDDQDAHEALLCVQTGSFLSDENRMSLKDMDLHLTDPLQIIERWKASPEVILNTKEIADRCHVTIDLGGILIPEFPLPKGVKEERYFRDLVYQGLIWRYGKKTREEALKINKPDLKKYVSEEIVERAEYELDTIIKMGFASYFLIVQDFINWGKQQQIVFGPGRGSAAGSIVSYALNITDLDPLKYDLLFERFLNPDRISMPDIDIDIQDNRRDEVIEYCVTKYGDERVAHIVTFGQMAARNAIRDVARVTEVAYAEADRLAKLVPPPVQGRHTKLKDHIAHDPDLRQEYETNQSSKQVIDLAMKLEGTIRSHGVHAAGVVMAPDDIVNYVPLEMAQKGVITTQYSMYPIEELGLLKMDFLGLSNLTTIKNALRIVKKVWNKEIDIAKIPLDDKKVYELLGKGETVGIFQFESGGMKRVLKSLKPSTFEDIAATGAMYRPGPMQFIDSFIARKHGKEEIDYMHPAMEPALKHTYGKIIYQEQVMQIAKDMCGFDGGQADTLRKAIGKKIPELMAKMREDFIEGGIKHSGAKKDLMESLWRQLEDFAAYSFNKAHSVSYGLISYQTAYLKAHYPQAFMAALMTSDYDDIDRLAIDINECKHMGIEVLAPDINESFLEFAVVPKTKQIRFGMAAIKNVGTGAVEELLEAREKGPFKSVEDFVIRVSSKVSNRKIMESLIKTGAFDKFRTRGELLHNLEKILAFASKKQKEVDSGQIDLFGESSSDVALKLELDKLDNQIPEREVLQWERELLGIYLSKHPLDKYEILLKETVVPIAKLTKKMDGQKATIGGVVQIAKEIVTRNGSKMAFVTIEDKTGEIEAIVFPDSYKKQQELWQRDTVLRVSGRLNTKDRLGNDEELKLLVEEAEIIEEDEATNYLAAGKKARIPKEKRVLQKKKVSKKQLVDNSKLYLLIKDPEDEKLLKELKRTLSKHSGEVNTILVLGEEKKNAIKLPFGVSLENGLKVELETLLGSGSVAVK